MYESKMKNNDELEDLLSRHCSCAVCHGVLRLPRILSCFHSFCTECLEKYISLKISENGQRTFPCPKCSKQIILPTEIDKETLVDNFKLDTFVTNLTDIIDAFNSDKSCDLCHRRDVTVTASHWCLKCCDALCEDCLKVHQCGKTTSDHAVVSLEEFHKMPLESVVKKNVIDRCQRHEEDMKMYCETCKEPVCVECFATSHRKCDSCVLVSNAVKTLESDLAEVNQRIHSLREEGGDCVPVLTTHHDILETSLKKAEADIRSLADELRKKIEHSENALIEELHSAGRHLLEKLSSSDMSNGVADDIDTTVLTSAQNRLTALMKYGSDVQVLDLCNKMKELLTKMEHKNISSSDFQSEWKVSFEMDKKVKNFKQDFEQLGEIRIDDGSTDDGLSSWGVTVTSRDDIVVADCRNHIIQKFSNTGERIDHVVLADEPRDITSFGEDEVAVSVLKKQILIFSSLTKFIQKRKIDTQRQYDGLAYSSKLRQFLASSLEDNCVDIVSRLGEVIKSVTENTVSGDVLFQSPRYVSLAKEDSYIVSNLWSNSVINVSLDGTLLFTYPSERDGDIKKPQGVCCDRLGNVFIGDYANNRVHLLTPDGKFQRFVLNKDNDLKRPVALAMTHSCKLVIVQSDGMVKVFSYDSPSTQSSASSHATDEERDQEAPLPHIGSLGIRRLSSYGGQGSGPSYAKMFGNPGAIHSSGVSYHSYRRHSENITPKTTSSGQSSFPNLPNSLRPRRM